MELVITGNLIGTDASGTATKGNGNDGIRILGPAIQDSLLNNVISGNAGAGIWMNGGTNFTIQGNKIGTTEDGSSGLGNQGAGIFAESVDTLQIGGDNSTERNIISDNAAAGIEIEGGESHTIQGNYVGAAADGTTALGKGQYALIHHKPTGKAGHKPFQSLYLIQQAVELFLTCFSYVIAYVENFHKNTNDVQKSKFNICLI